MNRARDESGMVTVFVVTMTMVLLLMAGLVVDGGAVLAARRQAIDVAEQAALAGAQGIRVADVRTGLGATLDPALAAAAAQAYLDEVGREGAVSVVGNDVEVTVSIERPMLILGLAGVGDVTVTGRAHARNARGVTTGDAP
jgi:uncharacterized membrane protein